MFVSVPRCNKTNIQRQGRAFRFPVARRNWVNCVHKNVPTGSYIKVVWRIVRVNALTKVQGRNNIRPRHAPGIFNNPASEDLRRSCWLVWLGWQEATAARLRVRRGMFRRLDKPTWFLRRVTSAESRLITQIQPVFGHRLN